MLYVFYRYRRDSTRELVLREGAPFPRHLIVKDWYFYGTHAAVNGRTEADIAMLGYCDRVGGGVSFGRRITGTGHQQVTRTGS